MSRWAGLLLLLFGLVLFTSSVFAEVPHLINYQGYLLSSGGAPITGPHNLTFQIYEDSLASDPVYWQELHVAVPVDAGLFHVVLGVTTPLADTVFVSAERWLGVTVDEDPEIAPRVRMTAVPWALKAAVADTALHSAPLPAHDHDDLYYRETELNAPGTINEPTNPVDWTKLKSAPAGFADGVDNTGGGGGGWADDGTLVRLETSTDKVGIGTSSPLYPLHVVNPSDSAYAYAVYGDASSVAATAYHDGVVGMNRSAATSQAGAGVFGFATSAVGGAAGVTGRASGQTGSGVSGVAAHTSGVNYGIYGQTLSSAGYAGYFLGGKNYFEGNVGIGTMTPSAKLDVAGTAQMTGFALSTGATNNYVLTSDGTGAGTWKAPQAAPDGDWIIADPNMYSGVSGNVGIGTTPHPNFRLHVVNPSAGAGCIGIYGVESSKSGDGHSGVAGETMDSSSTIPWSDRGVYGLANATSGAASGVFGLTMTPGGAGVYGSANDIYGVNYGVYGFTGSPNGFAGYFTGGKSYFDGPVGIGATTPAAELHVDNDRLVPLSCAVYGVASGTGLLNHQTGVYGEARSSSSTPDPGVGVRGVASATTGRGIGVLGSAESDSGYAGMFVGGRNYFQGKVGIGTSSPRWPLHVESAAPYDHACAIYGVMRSESGGRAAGMRGESYGYDGIGVYGAAYAYGDTGEFYGSGVYGFAPQSGYAGYFSGDVEVTHDLFVGGTIHGGGGFFVIDHPLDPENKLLRHSFVESPENLLIYRGKAKLDGKGEGIIQLPDYFEALTKEEKATVTLTPVGKPFGVGYEWQAGFAGFRAYGDPDREVSWVVYADRDDPVIHQLARPVEEEKGPGNKPCKRGKLLYPEAYGYPESMGTEHETRNNLRPDQPGPETTR